MTASRATSGKPSRGATAMRRQLEDPPRLAPGRQVRERLRRHDEHDVGRGPRPRSARPAAPSSVSTVYDGPSRSSSIRLDSEGRVAGDRQLDHGQPILAGRDGLTGLVRRLTGRDEQHLLQAEGLAASSATARCAMWIGSKVPPRTPSEPATLGSRTRRSHALPRLAPPIRARRRRSGRGRRSRSRRAAARRRCRGGDRSRWKRSADSSTSKLVWAAIRSIACPANPEDAVLLQLDEEAVAHRLDAVDDDAGRLGRLRQSRRHRAASPRSGPERDPARPR